MGELVEFFKYITKLFPISPYDHEYEHVKSALMQFESRKGEEYTFCSPLQSSDDRDIVQGDILEKLPFRFYNIDGGEREFKAKAMVISNSCDIENDDNIILAPAIPLDAINRSNTLCNIKKNLNTSWLYIPDSHLLKDFVIDFSLMNSFPKELLLNLLGQQRIKKIVTLNQLGYYMLLCKLTVHFMRPESEEVSRLAL